MTEVGIVGQQVRVLEISIATALLVGGCAMPSPVATPTSPVSTPASGCTGGGTCLGPLTAGTYTSGSFQPSITFTVPDGWVNDEDLPDSFNLRRDADRTGATAVWANHVSLHRDVSVAGPDCQDPEPDVGRSVEDIINWMTSHPGLATTAPEDISVGGLDGQMLDVGLADSWTEPCSWEGTVPMVAILTGPGLNQLGRVVVGDLGVRLYVLALQDGTVTIKVTDVPAGETSDHYLAEVVPIIDSFIFAAQ